MKYIKLLNWLTPKITWIITWIIPLGILWITIGILVPSILTCFNIIPITQNSIETLINNRLSNSIAFLGIPMAIMGFIMAIIAMKENVILTLVFEFTGYYSIIYFSILIILCFGVLSILQANLGNNEWFINATLSLNYLFFLNFLSIFYLISKTSKITSIENLINLVESKFIKNEAGIYTSFYNQQLIKKVKESDYNTIHVLLNSLANIFKEISIENFGNHIDTIKNIESKAVLNKDLDLIDKLLEFHTTIKKKGKEVNKENYGNLENLPIDIYNTSNKIHPEDCKSTYYHKQLVTKILENLSKLYIDNIIDYNTFCSKYTSLTNAFIKNNDKIALRKAIKVLSIIYDSIVNIEINKKEELKPQSSDFKEKIPYRILDIRYSIVDFLKKNKIKKDDAIKLYKITHKEFDETLLSIQTVNEQVFKHIKVKFDKKEVISIGFIIELIKYPSISSIFLNQK